MLDTLVKNPEYEQQPNREVERKLLPLFPEKLEQFRAQAVPVEQYYLSHYSERFSLRLRETVKNGELQYSAALKDEGAVTADGLDRLEEETVINAETYARLKTSEVPVLRKLRATPNDFVAIDFYEDGRTQVEAEDSGAWAQFVNRYGFGDEFMDVSGDKQANNEWQAHMLYKRAHDGKEALLPSPELDVDSIVRRIAEAYRKNPGVRVRIGGRSGSGKSTAIREIQSCTHELGITSEVISTDDYNIGKSALTATFGNDFHWDMPGVYDTDKLANDLTRLEHGEPVARRCFDFGTGEPYINDFIAPSGIYLVEGLYALSDTLATDNDIRIEIPTSIAECTGRRLHRDHYSGERDVSAAFPSAADSLRYILEIAEPAYRERLQ